MSPIQEYITKQRSAGIQDDQLRAELLKSGYSMADIDVALTPPVSFSPQTQPVPSAELTSQGMPHKKKLILGIVGALFFLSTLSAGAYWYYQRLPENVLKRMTTNMQTVKTFSYNTSVSIEGDVSGPTASLGDNGEPIMTDKEHVKAKASFSGSSSYWDGKTLNGFIRFGGEYEAGKDKYSIGEWEVRGVGTKIYLGMLAFPKVEMDIAVLSSYVNAWLEIDITEYLKKIPDLLKKAEKDSELTKKQEEQVKKITEVLNKKKIVTKIRTFQDEKISDVLTSHYQLEIDKVALVDAMTEIDRIISEGEKKDRNISSINEEWDTKIHPVDIWVGKKDELLYKLSAKVETKDKKAKTGPAIVGFEFGMSDHNKAIEVKKPTGKIWTTKTLMQDIQTKLASQSPSLRTTSPSTYPYQPVLGEKTQKPSIAPILLFLLQQVESSY